MIIHKFESVYKADPPIVHTSFKSIYKVNPHIEHCPMDYRIKPRHLIGGVQSQMNINSWEYYLSFESDKNKQFFLMDGVENGFRIVDIDANVSLYECDNYNSVFSDHAFEFVNSLIHSEVKESKLVVTQDKPRCVHSLGAIPKRDGSYRPITDCRRPEGVSINNYMDSTFQTFNYTTIDQVAHNVTQDCYMATVDIAAAYRSISIRQDNWQYQGISWPIQGEKAYLYDVRLSFGIRCAAYIFTEISDFMVRSMDRLGYPKVANYLDDFLVYGTTYEECQDAQTALVTLLGELGFIVSWKKCSTPSTCVRYLGILIDSVSMTLSLPQDKLDKLKCELQFFSTKSRATKHQIQRLCGIIAHCAKVVRGGRTFSRRIIDLLSGLKEGNPRIRLTEEFRMDVQWWIDFAEQFNGKENIILPNDGSGPTFATDSCLKGYGLVSNNDWQAGFFNSEECPRDIHKCNILHGHWLNIRVHDQDNINYLELVPVWLALIRYHREWKDTHVLCMSDNTQVIHMLMKGHSTNRDCMILLRRIFWLCATGNIHITPVHIAGDHNIIPDCLSRVYNNKKLAYVFTYGICCSESGRA